MELLAVEDGHITLRLHWQVAQIITDALKGGNDDEAELRTAEAELEIEMLATAFEAATMAANLQVATAETELMTLDWLRETGGDRNAMRRAENAANVT